MTIPAADQPVAGMWLKYKIINTHKIDEKYTSICLPGTVLKVGLKRWGNCTFLSFPPLPLLPSLQLPDGADTILA